MKYAIAIALTLLSASASNAASPEETYVATRDAAIAKLNPPGDPVAPTEAALKEEERVRAELGKQLRSVIGPLNVQGFSGEGAYNVGSLFKGDIEFGTLDGLEFTKPRDVRLVVTTTGLADNWAKSRDGLGAEDAAVPPDLLAALKHELFYTRAISTDSAVGNFGELPVTKPAGAEFVFAMLAARRQDFGTLPADEILVSVIVPPRMYVVSTPIDKIRMMAPCDKLFKDAEAKAFKTMDANESSEEKKENAVDELDKMREQADEAMRKCFAARIKTDPAFARLTKQAQEIVDGLAEK